MANSNGWGDGSVNNNIGWGQGANNSTGWGKSHLSSWSGATDIDGGNLPVNSVAPAITGTAQEGQTLTCSTGTWSGSPTYTYQWKRNGSNIGSATNSTYVLVTADVGQNILCTVTATNFVGSATADSNTVTPTSAFSFLLDTYPGAAAAYSLRKLRTAYTGSAIRVRRSSDNAEQDFGFVSNVLDTVSLLTFCGAGSGFVTTWYDQSNAARNATISTAVEQPRIVNAGVLDTLNSKPSIINPNDGVIRRLITSLSYTQPLPVAVILAGRINQLPTNPFGNITFTLGGSTVGVGGGGRYEFIASPTYFGAGIRGGSYITISPFNTIPFIQQANFRSSQLDLRFNGVDATPVAHSGTPFGTPGTFQLFGGGGISTDAQFYSNINISEVIIYVSDEYTNRTGIESNINSFYSIY